MQACAQIYVEVDLGKGLLEAIKLKVDDWSHIQQLDYEQIPFKCEVCHEYGHFANRCTKLIDVENGSQEEQWEMVKKKKTVSSVKAPLDSGPSTSSAAHPTASSPTPSKPPPLSRPQTLPSSNPFFVLSTPDPQEPPLPKSQRQDTIESSLPLTISSQPLLDPPLNRITRSSSKDHGGSSEPSKKPGLGRKSAKQHRDENVQKVIAMGMQTPIETYILEQHGKEAINKDQGGRAPPRTPHIQ